MYNIKADNTWISCNVEKSPKFPLRFSDYVTTYLPVFKQHKWLRNFWNQSKIFHLFYKSVPLNTQHLFHIKGWAISYGYRLGTLCMMNPWTLLLQDNFYQSQCQNRFNCLYFSARALKIVYCSSSNHRASHKELWSSLLDV